MTTDETRDQSGNSPEQIVTEALRTATDNGADRTEECAAYAVDALRAAGLLVEGAPTDEQPWNDPGDPNSPTYDSPWSKASAIIETIRAAQLDLLHNRPVEDVQDEITLSINRLDELCATMLAGVVSSASSAVSDDADEHDDTQKGEAESEDHAATVTGGNPEPSADREKLIDEARGFWEYNPWDPPGDETEAESLVRRLADALAAPAPVHVDYDGLGAELFEKSHEPSFDDDAQGMAEAVELGRRLVEQYVNTETVAPVDEAKLAEVIAAAYESDAARLQGVNRHDERAARAVREYLDSMR